MITLYKHSIRKKFNIDFRDIKELIAHTNILGDVKTTTQ